MTIAKIVGRKQLRVRDARNGIDQQQQHENKVKERNER